MSILIKGISLPKSLFESLYVSIDNHGDVYVYRNGKRLDYVKAIELPPHGRLIDERWLKDAMATTLEALVKNPKMDAQEMHIIAAFDTLREMIEDAPTIIESEGEDG